MGICGTGSDGGVMIGVGWPLHGDSSDDRDGWGLNEKRVLAKYETLISCPIKSFLPCNYCTTSKRLYREECHG